MSRNMIEVLSESLSAAIEYGNIKKYPVLYLPIKEDIPRTNLVDPNKASIHLSILRLCVLL